jgi:hypothetical protein
MTKTHLLLCAVTALAAISRPLLANPHQQGCFEMHIRESIAINKSNKEAYAKLAGKDAKKVLNTLISSEYLTLIPAAVFDNEAKPFRREGMDLLCQEFQSMEQDQKAVVRNEIPKETFQHFNWKPYSLNIKKALKQNDVSLVRTFSLGALDTLGKQPHFHCFTRHMVESIYRMAYFVDVREAEAKRLKLQSPRKLMMKLIRTHLESLSFARDIDQLAKPIQEKGVQILCNELPDLLRDLPLTEEQV